MVKTIKTVKQLKKHIGETLRVVSEDGYTFDATVEEGGNPADPWLVLKTTNKMANKDRFWWMLGGKVCHNCAFDDQISKELKSLTTTTEKKASKKKSKYLTMTELDDARGHFCLLEDGSKGFICTKTESEEKPARVLHNCPDAIGWNYTGKETPEDDAPEAIKHDFVKAYNVWSDDDAFSLKVIKVLEKYDGRKYRFKKAKKDEKILTASEIQAGVGHLCRLADGQESFIATNAFDIPIVCMRSRSSECGWCLESSDVAPKFRDSIKDYKYGWGISDEEDAKSIKVVSILDEPKAEAHKAKEETPKTILDMTIREVLEKLDEIIKR